MTAAASLCRCSPRFTVTYKAIEPDLAAFDAAYALYQGKSYSKAIKALNALLEEYPKSGQRFRARFGWPKVLFKQEHEKAKAEYDTILKESTTQLLRDTRLTNGRKSPSAPTQLP